MPCLFGGSAAGYALVVPSDWQPGKYKLATIEGRNANGARSVQLRNGEYIEFQADQSLDVFFESFAVGMKHGDLIVN